MCKTGTENPEAPAAKPPPCCPVKMIVFTVNLLVGLVAASLLSRFVEPSIYGIWQHVVKICTMFCLSYIMIGVGYEFDVDKSKMRQYGKDYLIAMTAAGFPWIFVALWFRYVMPNPLPWDEALIASRFAAPTSAGILFSMLTASGMKDTWLFRKARILAIFDDLDTILLMIPLKMVIVGLRWELSIDVVFVIVLLACIWFFLHRLKIPYGWRATMGYAAVVTLFCEMMHFLTHDTNVDPNDVIETVHLEVLLPAFAVGCVAHTVHIAQVPRHSTSSRASGATPMKRGLTQRFASFTQQLKEHRDDREFVDGAVSALFMLFVGLMVGDTVGTSLFGSGGGGGHRRLSAVDGGNTTDAHGSASAAAPSLPAGELVLHVVAVSVLMILGKMFPTFCYRDEASLRSRIALSLGMCPRGEVGAGVIFITLSFNIQGPAITVAVICLALNLIASTSIIQAVKKLSTETPGASSHPVPVRTIAPTDDDTALSATVVVDEIPS